MLFGVYDIGAIILVAVVNALMNFFGLDMEEINYYTKKLNWKTFILGTIAGLAPWIVILLYGLSAKKTRYFSDEVN